MAASASSNDPKIKQQHDFKFRESKISGNSEVFSGCCSSALHNPTQRCSISLQKRFLLLVGKPALMFQLGHQLLQDIKGYSLQTLQEHWETPSSSLLSSRCTWNLKKVACLEGRPKWSQLLACLQTRNFGIIMKKIVEIPIPKISPGISTYELVLLWTEAPTT